MQRTRLAVLPAALCIVLPLVDLGWNLTHLNIGLLDFYGVALAARACAIHGAWPQTPYFPVLYPLLLVPFGLAGSVLVGGYLLSAGGLILALFAVRRLWLILSTSSGGRQTAVSDGAAERASQDSSSLAHNPTLHTDGRNGSLATAATGSILLFLAWLMPVWRVVAGSPSVDALYTGLGLWFLTAALVVWQGGRRIHLAAAGPGTPAWAVGVLWLTALLLPMLRYHAVVLVLPVTVALLLCCRHARWTARAALTACILGMVLNYAGYLMAYGELLPQVAPLQIRCGIEFEQHVHYATPQALWDDYAAFAAHGRGAPLLADYSFWQITRHVLHNLLMFLRQPTILLALVLLLVAAQRAAWPHIVRPLRDDGLPLPLQLGIQLLLAVWLVVYCLSLASAYYTARAALLPCLVALALALALAIWQRPWVQLALLGLLLAGYGLGSRFAWADFEQRRRAAAQRAGPDSESAGAVDPQWELPAEPQGGSWLDDGAIPRIVVDDWPLRDP